MTIHTYIHTKETLFNEDYYSIIVWKRSGTIVVEIDALYSTVETILCISKILASDLSFISGITSLAEL